MDEDKEMRSIVAEVAAAYFSNSHVAATDIPIVIRQIATSLSSVGTPAAPVTEQTPDATARKLSPAQIRKSITPDALISFEDNKPYKTLRRHLAVKGLSPEQYREKWGLPKDYPMVAPSYSETRAKLARAAGLGASRLAAAAAARPSAPETPSGSRTDAAARTAAESAPASRKVAARKAPGRKPSKKPAS